MRRIRGSFAQLTDKANYSGTALDDYLHAILTDETDVPEAMGQLRMIYPNLLQLTYDNTRTRADRIVDGVEQVQNRSKLELFEELYEKQNNQPMSREQRSLVQTLIEEIWEGQV
jgi:exonuclease SbcD